MMKYEEGKREKGRGNSEEGGGKRECGAWRKRPRQTNPPSAQTQGQEWEGDERTKYKVRRTKEEKRGNREQGRGNGEVQTSKVQKKGFRGRGSEGLRTCGMRISEWRKLSVVSLQLSVECLAATRRGARRNCGMRISDCGLNNQSRESAAAEPVTTDEPRTTNHEPRRTAVAKRSQLSASSTPQERKAGRCLNQRMIGAGVHQRSAISDQPSAVSCTPRLIRVAGPQRKRRGSTALVLGPQRKRRGSFRRPAGWHTRRHCWPFSLTRRMRYTWRRARCGAMPETAQSRTTQNG